MYTKDKDKLIMKHNKLPQVFFCQGSFGENSY